MNEWITSEVSGELSIAEPSGGFVVDEVSSVRREVSLDERLQIVVVSHIDNRVAEDAERWD